MSRTFCPPSLSYPGEMSLGPASSVKLASLTEHSAKRPCSDWHGIPWLCCVRPLPSSPSPLHIISILKIWKDIDSLQHSPSTFIYLFFFSPSSPPASFLGASECCVKLSEEFICGFLSFFFLSSCTCVVESNALDTERTQPLQSQHSLFCVFVLFPSRLMPVVSEKGCLHSVVKFAIDVPMKRGQGSSHWLDNTINCSSCFIWSL